MLALLLWALACEGQALGQCYANGTIELEAYQVNATLIYVNNAQNIGCHVVGFVRASRNKKGKNRLTIALYSTDSKYNGTIVVKNGRNLQNASCNIITCLQFAFARSVLLI